MNNLLCDKVIAVGEGFGPSKTREDFTGFQPVALTKLCQPTNIFRGLHDISVRGLIDYSLEIINFLPLISKSTLVFSDQSRSSITSFGIVTEYLKYFISPTVLLIFFCIFNTMVSLRALLILMYRALNLYIDRALIDNMKQIKQFDCGCENDGGSFYTYPSGATECWGCNYDKSELDD